MSEASCFEVEDAYALLCCDMAIAYCCTLDDHVRLVCSTTCCIDVAGQGVSVFACVVAAALLACDDMGAHVREVPVYTSDANVSVLPAGACGIAAYIDDSPADSQHVDAEFSSGLAPADVFGPADAECPVFASCRTGLEWFEGIAECGCVRCAPVREFCCGVRAEIERLSDTREIVLTNCGDRFVSDVNCVVCRALAGDLRLGPHSSLLQSPTAWRLIAKMIGAQLVDLREVLGLANGSDMMVKVVGLFAGRCADLFFGCLTEAAGSSGGEP